jgi:hypothetical protein
MVPVGRSEGQHKGLTEIHPLVSQFPGGDATFPVRLLARRLEGVLIAIAGNSNESIGAIDTEPFGHIRKCVRRQSALIRPPLHRHYWLLPFL